MTKQKMSELSYDKGVWSFEKIKEYIDKNFPWNVRDKAILYVDYITYNQWTEVINKFIGYKNFVGLETNIMGLKVKYYVY